MLGKHDGLTALVGGAATLDEKNRQLSQHRGRQWSVLAWQIAGMLVGSFEKWLVLESFGRSTTAWNSITLRARVCRFAISFSSSQAHLACGKPG